MGIVIVIGSRDRDSDTDKRGEDRDGDSGSGSGSAMGSGSTTDIFIIPFRNLSRLGNKVQADIRVVISHNEKRLDFAGHLLADDDIRLTITIV